MKWNLLEITERVEISEILPVASRTDSAAQYTLLVTQDPAVATQNPTVMLAYLSGLFYLCTGLIGCAMIPSMLASHFVGGSSEYGRMIQ